MEHESASSKPIKFNFKNRLTASDNFHLKVMNYSLAVSRLWSVSTIALLLSHFLIFKKNQSCRSSRWRRCASRSSACKSATNRGDACMSCIRADFACRLTCMPEHDFVKIMNFCGTHAAPQFVTISHHPNWWWKSWRCMHLAWFSWFFPKSWRCMQISMNFHHLDDVRWREPRTYDASSGNSGKWWKSMDFSWKFTLALGKKSSLFQKWNL